MLYRAKEAGRNRAESKTTRASPYYRGFSSLAGHRWIISAPSLKLQSTSPSERRLLSASKHPHFALRQLNHDARCSESIQHRLIDLAGGRLIILQLHPWVDVDADSRIGQASHADHGSRRLQCARIGTQDFVDPCQAVCVLQIRTDSKLATPFLTTLPYAFSGGSFEYRSYNTLLL